MLFSNQSREDLRLAILIAGDPSETQLNLIIQDYAVSRV